MSYQDGSGFSAILDLVQVFPSYQVQISAIELFILFDFFQFFHRKGSNKISVLKNVFYVKNVSL